MRLRALLFKDTHIADSIKASYCNMVKSNIAAYTEAVLKRQQAALNDLAKHIFADDITNDARHEFFGALLMVLGGALTAVGVAVATITLSPFFGAAAIIPGVAALVAGTASFFSSTSIDSKAKQITSDVFEQGKEAIESIKSCKR